MRGEPGMDVIYCEFSSWPVRYYTARVADACQRVIYRPQLSNNDVNPFARRFGEQAEGAGDFLPAREPRSGHQASEAVLYTAKPELFFWPDVADVTTANTK